MLSVISNFILAIMAVVAGFVSYFKYRSHKQKENNKQFSQLNKRYLNDKDIQAVVRYIREIDPDDTLPRPYKNELFLRFFEELGVYLRDGNLPVNDVINFFGFYLKQLYKTERGKELLAPLNNDEKKWK